MVRAVDGQHHRCRIVGALYPIIVVNKRRWVPQE
jgi:hypothetical protein